MFGMFLAQQALKVSDNVDATHKSNERAKQARIAANPTSGEALGQAAKYGAGLLTFLGWLVTTLIVAIGHTTFTNALTCGTTITVALIAAVVGAIVGPVLVALAR